MKKVIFLSVTAATLLFSDTLLTAKTEWKKTKETLTTCKFPASNSTAQVNICKPNSTLVTETTESRSINPEDACPKICKKTSWTGWWQTNHTDQKKAQDGCECVAK